MGNNGLIEVPFGGKKRMIYITADEGFQPMFECKEILTNKLGARLLNEVGITDMTQEYVYGGKKYSLVYLSSEDMVMFISEINNDLELKDYRKLASSLINERKKKLNSGPYVK